MSLGSFDESFDVAFDVVAAHAAGIPVRMFYSDRAPGPADHAGIGEIWLDDSARPIGVWVMMPGVAATDPPGWALSGELRPMASVGSSYRLKAAALLLAVRWYKLPDAALGLVGGYDLGVSYVGRIGRDIEELLIGYRGIGVPMGQEWPTVDALKVRLQITTAREDPALELALGAAIEGVIEFVDGPPAVG